MPRLELQCLVDQRCNDLNLADITSVNPKLGKVHDTEKQCTHQTATMTLLLRQVRVLSSTDACPVYMRASGDVSIVFTKFRVIVLI